MTDDDNLNDYGITDEELAERESQIDADRERAEFFIARAVAGDRWPLKRTGERDEIPWMTRVLVKIRDNRHCRNCGATGPLELDHIIPWSAGGSDRSDNLQTLCATCNGKRSNFYEMWLPRVVPVTPVCDSCYANHDEIVTQRGGSHGTPKFPLWWYCGLCYSGEAPPVMDQYIPAFCGTCMTVSRISSMDRAL